MDLGKRVRLNRIFAHPSGRLCSVAVDHWLGYDQQMPPGLRHIGRTLAAIVEGQPDAITMHKGMAKALWSQYAGEIPLIIQASAIRPDDSAREFVATPEDAVRLGADAFAIAVFVRGATEAAYMRALADAVRESERPQIPVICHIYPRNMQGTPRISYAPEDIAWAVRCAVEAGADVIKTPYCGDLQAHRQIVADCPVPLVAAGGPQTRSLEEALRMMADAVEAGVLGATIGRNIWGVEQVKQAVLAFKAVIHDRRTPREAMDLSGL